MPALERLRRGLGVQGLLGQVVVVQRHVAVQSLFEVVAGAEVARAQQVGDTAVEALLQGASLPLEDLAHAVGLWPSRPRQAVLDAERLTQLIEHVLPGRGAFAGGHEAAGEFRAVVGEQDNEARHSKAT